MKVTREKRKGIKILRITTSAKQVREDEQNRYYWVYLTMFVIEIEKEGGRVVVVNSEVDKYLADTQGKKKKAFRKEEDDRCLNVALEKIA